MGQGCESIGMEWRYVLSLAKENARAKYYVDNET